MVWSATRRAPENKEEGGEVEEEAEEAESGERVDEVEKTEERKRGEDERRAPCGGFAAGIIGVSSLPTGHNGPSWRVAKRPLLGW